MGSAENEVLVLGGGVIGVCCAYYLVSSGKTVTLIEKGEICSGCSYGNVGLVTLSHAVPLPAPGVLTKAFKWMFDPESPFYFKPRFDPALFSWLLKFAAACNEQKVRSSMAILRDLTRASIELYEQLAVSKDFGFGYERKGLLGVFRTFSGFQEAREHAAALRDMGIESSELNSSEVRQMEPSAGASIVGGVYFPEDQQLVPEEFVRGLAQVAAAKGAKICTHTEVTDFSVSNRKVVNVRTSVGNLYPSTVVVAAGAWSTCLAHKLGIKLPVQPGKGYSVKVNRVAQSAPACPLWLGESRVIVTPMGDTLRIGGTMELSGMDTSVNSRRVSAIVNSLKYYLDQTEDLHPIENWSGLRPCTPDGLPIIGWSRKIENVLFATGHAMLGITLGPITGKLIAESICGQAPRLDLRAFDPERFS